MSAYASLILLGFAALLATTPVTRPYEQVQVHMGMPVRIVAYARSEVAARDAVNAAYERIVARPLLHLVIWDLQFEH